MQSRRSGASQQLEKASTIGRWHNENETSAGWPGKLHAKCAIVDDVALIGSANLTDDAFNRNMELGILVKDASIVDAIARHFEELIRLGIIVEVEPTDVPPELSSTKV